MMQHRCLFYYFLYYLMIYMQIIKKAMEHVWQLSSSEAEKQFSAGIKATPEETAYELACMKADVTEADMRRHNEKLNRKAAELGFN